jgi:mevalonate kinase
MFSTFAHGKLLLTGEYAVLDGALALAIPVRYGQTFTVLPGEKPGILTWNSKNNFDQTWFSATFQTEDWSILETTDAAIAERLQDILVACRVQQPSFLKEKSASVTMAADFPLNWGLGSSSTLIAAVARWAGIDPYPLLAATFGGSGYDIACAFAEGPLLYRLNPSLPAGQRESVERVAFDPPFKDQLHFIYLGKKQDSREGIQRYREMVAGKNSQLVADISALTRKVLSAIDLPAFEVALLAHERLLADALALPRAQDLYFPDFPGVIKSLGAWGGDFVLATLAGSDDTPLEELREKGFLVFGYREMVR